MRVVFLTAILSHYRIRFHTLVREALAARGVQYDVVYGAPDAAEAAKGDTAELPWGVAIKNESVLHPKLLWQPALAHLSGADLIVMGQESRFIINYLLQSRLAGGGAKLAFWGHGRNFQARTPDSLAERWKRIWARRVHWWFAYTEETKRHLTSIGFPAERITVFNNSVDTFSLRRDAAAVTPERCAARRAELGIGDGPVGIYVGGLYAEKRLTFLVEACDRVRTALPGFTLIMVGGGEAMGELQALAVARPWVKVAGPRFGADKVELMSLGDLFLMPGLVGLAVLDAAVLGLPLVTTAYPYHSPEIAYLRDGVNGLIVQDWENPDAYAGAIIGLLQDTARRTAMAEASKAAAEGFTIEAMAERFSIGALAALGLGPVR